MTQQIPVGTCSRKRAEYLMMAAAVAGGAIYVSCPPIPGVTEDEDGLRVGYLCCGTLPSGEAVPTRTLDAGAVLTALDRETARVAGIFGEGDEWPATIKSVAANLRTKLADGGAP